MLLISFFMKYCCPMEQWSESELRFYRHPNVIIPKWRPPPNVWLNNEIAQIGLFILMQMDLKLPEVSFSVPYEYLYPLNDNWNDRGCQNCANDAKWAIPFPFVWKLKLGHAVLVQLCLRFAAVSTCWTILSLGCWDSLWSSR